MSATRSMLLLSVLLLAALVSESKAEARRNRGRSRSSSSEESRKEVEEALNSDSEEESERQGKILSLFQIVRFPNDACVGGPSKNGTCYTGAECEERGGAAQGTCAAGYGVCCIFTVNCGARSNENCTYFEATGAEMGGCSVKICKCDSSVCQLRLDFNQFVISGPSTSTASTSSIVGGGPSGVAGAASASLASRCLTDTFSATNPGGVNPPTICGVNTGEHMYIDASQACNDLTFMLGQAANGVGLNVRQWSIKVTQYSCGYNNLAPKGCTQYFFGDTMQTVQTYNFMGGQHLANQNQNICVRQERGNCRICWTTQQDSDFMVSGPTATMSGFAKGSICCGYGASGLLTMGYDCVIIPGALKAMTTTVMGASQICGRSKGLVSVTGTLAVTICSDRQPFNIRFQSDNFEFAMEALKMDIGFRLTYIQTSQNC